MTVMPMSAPRCVGLEPKRFQRAGEASRQHIVNVCLMMPGQLPEFIGQGEGDHKIVNRQQLGLLTPKPFGGLMVLTLGAAAVSTGQGPLLGLAAFGATYVQLTRIRCTTSLYSADGAQMAGEEPGGIICLAGRIVLINDRGELHDHRLRRSTCKVLTRRLMMIAAFCSVASVRWA